MSRSETVRDNLRSLAEAGLHPGNLPLGYLPGPRPGDPPVPDPLAAPVIAAAFRLRARGYGLAEICRLLEALGARSRRGRPLSRQALRAVLANPFYAGKVRLNGKFYEGRHEPLVSEELFWKVQGHLTERRLNLL